MSLQEIILRGWECFAERVPDDIANAVFAVHDDPAPLGQSCRSRPSLLHGDAKLGNVGRRDGRSLLIDWGELTGWGPAEMDLTWFAATSTHARSGRDLVCRRDAGRPVPPVRGVWRPLDPDALDLACIGQLAQQGFVLAAFAAYADSITGERCSRLLEWWVARGGPCSTARRRHDGSAPPARR